MSNAGRPRKPRALKIADGTYRANRQPKKSVDTKGPPPCPRNLKGKARECWKFVITHRKEWCDKSDALMLRTLCDTWEQLQIVTQELKDQPTYKNRMQYGMVLKWWMTLAKGFGLDPQSRERLGISGEDDHADDKTSQYLA